jgi:hypothetical protein
MRATVWTRHPINPSKPSPSTPEGLDRWCAGTKPFPTDCSEAGLKSWFKRHVGYTPREVRVEGDRILAFPRRQYENNRMYWTSVPSGVHCWTVVKAGTFGEEVE